jgi:hypothetical protein
MNKYLREAQQMKKSFEKGPLHRIKSILEVNFDKASGGGSRSTILPEQLLCQINVINHVSPTKEGVLSWINNALDGTF